MFLTWVPMNKTFPKFQILFWWWANQNGPLPPNFFWNAPQLTKLIYMNQNKYPSFYESLRAKNVDEQS
jgi:hypothetical protein